MCPGCWGLPPKKLTPSPVNMHRLTLMGLSTWRRVTTTGYCRMAPPSSNMVPALRAQWVIFRRWKIQCPPAPYRYHSARITSSASGDTLTRWQDETILINQVAADMCKLQGITWNGPNLTTGLFGAGDTEQVTQHAWRLLNATSFAPGEVYSGVRFEKEGEDNGLNLPFNIVKQCNSPATRVRSEQ